MRRDREHNREGMCERVRTVGSVLLRGWHGHFAWATVNQLRAVTELLRESHEAEDYVLCLFAIAL